MIILSIDSSAVSASCAIIKDGKVFSENFINNGLTHSETLAGMVENMLKIAKINISDIDCYAVSAGPGSFTGVRIGVCLIKGMAIVNSTPCISISTLRAIAENGKDLDGYLCPVMDARRNQFYNAIFKVENGEITRLCDDRAAAFDDLIDEIKKLDKTVYLVGDGAEICYNKIEEKCNIKLISKNNMYQRGSGVGLAAVAEYEKGNTISADRLLPIYLRPSQAERERNKKLEG